MLRSPVEVTALLKIGGAVASARATHVAMSATADRSRERRRYRSRLRETKR